VNTEHRVLRSSVAGYAIQLTRLLVSFLPRLVLARLVLPDQHGLYDEALRIVMVAAALRDLGLPYHLVRDERRPFGTVLAAVLGLGTLLTVLLVAGAPLAGVFTPQLPPVLRVLALFVLLDGLAVVPRAFFERELTIGDLVVPEIGRGLLVAGVSIGLAWAGWGVWAFVTADLLGAAALAALSWRRAWGRIPLRVDLALLPGLVRQSGWLFAIWLVVQLVTYVDVYIVELYAATATVGLYGRAWWLAFLVPAMAYPRALFPTLVAYRGDPLRFLAAFRLGAVPLLACQVVASWFLLLNAERVLRILLGAGWEGAAPLLRVLAFVALLDQFGVLGGELLKACHDDRAWFLTTVLNLVALVGCGLLLTRQHGAIGMAAANFARLGTLVMAWRVWRAFGERPWALLGDWSVLLLLPVPSFGLVAWLTAAGSWERFAASLVAAALTCGLLVARYRTPFRAFFRGGQPGTASAAAP
jgi:PST family polysaccharide transporter